MESKAYRTSAKKRMKHLHDLQQDLIYFSQALRRFKNKNYNMKESENDQVYFLRLTQDLIEHASTDLTTVWNLLIAEKERKEKEDEMG